MFGDLNVDEKRLSRIGWTKVQIIAKHIDQDNCEELLTIAENSSAHDVALLMRGGEASQRHASGHSLPEGPPIQNLLSGDLAHGGSKSGNGLANKEFALVAALSKLGYGNMAMK